MRVRACAHATGIYTARISRHVFSKIRARHVSVMRVSARLRVLIRAVCTSVSVCDKACVRVGREKEMDTTTGNFDDGAWCCCCSSYGGGGGGGDLLATGKTVGGTRDTSGTPDTPLPPSPTKSNMGKSSDSSFMMRVCVCAGVAL